jgi:hypothetical protein
MFTKPKNGWVNLELSNLSLRASYLTNVPNNCLDAFIYGLKNNRPVTIFFDAEGWDFHLVSSHYCSYIIVHKDKLTVHLISKDFRELAQELIDDIELYLYDWANWECYDDKSESEIEDISDMLYGKVLILKSLLNK